MYIEDLIDEIGLGDSAYSLFEYIAGQSMEEIYLKDIMSETGLDKLKSFKVTDEPVVVEVDGIEDDVPYAIDLVIALALLVLETEKSGAVDFMPILDADIQVSIVASDKEIQFLSDSVADFVEGASSYDIAEMFDEDELEDMVSGCKHLLEELKDL